VLKAHTHCDWCEAIDVCACLSVVVHKAHGPSDCCEAMHSCACLCVLVLEAHAHGGYACVCVCGACSQ
jgi:hypothetical protein